MRRLAAMLAFALALAPALARACPACARDGNPAGVAWLIGAMIAAPLLLAGVAFVVARRLEGER